MMVMFTTYIYITLNYSSFIPCSCGGILESMGWTPHLIFNLCFIVLALIGIVMIKGFPMRYHFSRPVILGWLSLLALSGIGMVTLLFITSENTMQHRNPFIRRYPHFPAVKTAQMDLTYDSYYIAGVGDGKIYLGNNTAPLRMVVID